MGQQQSTEAAEQHALRGWPAFMTAKDVQAQMHKFRVRKSVMGWRVRFLDRTDGCIEYVKLSVQTAGGADYYQRVDGPCGERASVPKFPHALAANELDAPRAPYAVTINRPNYAELADRSSSKCATYRRSRQGIWVKVAEQCRETMHELEVLAQRGNAKGKDTAQLLELLARRRTGSRRRHGRLRQYLNLD